MRRGGLENATPTVFERILVILRNILCKSSSTILDCCFDRRVEVEDFFAGQFVLLMNCIDIALFHMCNGSSVVERRLRQPSRLRISVLLSGWCIAQPHVRPTAK